MEENTDNNNNNDADGRAAQTLICATGIDDY